MTPREPVRQDRVRITIDTSTKGVFTFSATVELVGDITGLTAEALKESDALVAQLRERYKMPTA